jgi:two-component system LytT family sensor kinase
LETSGGNITAHLPLQQGLQLDVKAGKIRTPYFTHFTGTHKRHRINGQLNGGGASVNLKTSGGRVAIRPYEANMRQQHPHKPPLPPKQK